MVTSRCSLGDYLEGKGLSFYGRRRTIVEIVSTRLKSPGPNIQDLRLYIITYWNLFNGVTRGQENRHFTTTIIFDTVSIPFNCKRVNNINGETRLSSYYTHLHETFPFLDTFIINYYKNRLCTGFFIM